MEFRKRAIVCILAMVMFFSLIQFPVKDMRAGEVRIKSKNVASEVNGISLGDYIYLGNYYNKPILWRCVDRDENGWLMLSDKILCFKAYDALGEDDYYHSDGWGYIRKQYGSNCWEDSSIRQWLNANSDTVIYSHCSPSTERVGDGYNPYDTEPGFLYNFKVSEQNCIKQVMQVVHVNEWETKREGYCDGGFEEIDCRSIYDYPLDMDYTKFYYKRCSDKIFLLNASQIRHIYNNFGDYIYTYPTEEAVQNNDEQSTEIASTEICSYRTSVPGTIGASFEHVETIPMDSNPGGAYTSCGIRPAFYLDEKLFSGRIYKEKPSDISTFIIDSTKLGNVEKSLNVSGTLTLSDNAETSSDILSSEVSAIKWISSDQSIVSNSEISCTGVNSYDNRSAELMISFTPHKEGKVTITGTASNGLTASCEVTVKDTKVTDFSIDSYTKGTINNLFNIFGKMKISKTGESTEDILKEEIGNIKWEINNPSIVKVTGCSITKVSDQGWVELKISVEPKKNGKATITGTSSNGLKASGEIEITDAYIIQRVARYTSDNIYEQFDKINNSNYSIEKKYQKFYELFSNFGFTNVKEGISYLSETTAERYAYLMLTTDDCFTASQFVYELNNTAKGKAMRATLIADGLIFNSEWKTWTDPLSLSASNGEFPGVKKYKEMLYDYMQVQSKSIECADYVKTVTDLTDKVVDVTKAQILQEVNDTNDPAKVLDVMRKYSDVLFTYDEDGGAEKRVTIDESSGFGKFAKAEGYASTGISIASTALEDVMGFIQLDGKLKAYQENQDFLNEVIRSAGDLPSELRYAAYLIREEMEAGVGTNIKDLALDIVKISKLTKNTFTDILKKHGISTPSTLMNFLGQLDVGVWFSNQILNMASVVKKEAYVEGYAYLAGHFTKLLEQNKRAFLNNRTEENAWNFYYTYHTLYQIRQKGEESYLAMCNVKGLAAGLAKKGINYKLKEEVVNSILGILKERCQFTLPEGMEIPKSVSYHSKFVVQCPVDLEVLDSSGNVVIRLSDQIESDVTNSYGRFAVVYMPYTDEYAKVICLNQNSGCSIRTIGTDIGLVNLEMALKTDDRIFNYKMNNEAVSKDTVIYIDLTELSLGKDELEYQKWELDNPKETESKTIESVQADKPEVDISEIRLNKETMELNQGEESIINVAAYPTNASNQRVRWMSGDDSIAIVKDGKVSAVGLGETTIYCTSLDNLDVSASCNIKVTLSKEQESGGNNPSSSDTSKNTYIITYDLSGGKMSGNPASYTEDVLPITLKNPTQSGYTFVGWTGSNGGVPQKTVTIAKGSTGNKTYKANWIKNQTSKTSVKSVKIILKKASYTYDGKKKQPSITVKIGSKTLKKDLDYRLVYKNNQKVGTASVIISGMGEYTGKVTKRFKIVPKGTSLLKAVAKSKGFVVSWRKQAKSTDGYQLQYSTSKKFTKNTTVTKTVKKISKTKLDIKKCKATKKYYISIRTYKIVKGKKYYSGWSKVKVITAKK